MSVDGETPLAVGQHFAFVTVRRSNAEFLSTLRAFAEAHCLRTPGNIEGVTDKPQILVRPAVEAAVYEHIETWGLLGAREYWTLGEMRSRHVVVHAEMQEELVQKLNLIKKSMHICPRHVGSFRLSMPAWQLNGPIDFAGLTLSYQ